MEEAAKLLIGIHDYASFCSNPKMKKSTVREVDSIQIIKKDNTYVLPTTEPVFSNIW